ncbi:MAG: hypothetical protein H8D32_05190 [Dehalococcoidia bacterium]|nr:hypothetical protein [Dehalococcoidia bacterium]
MPLGRMICVLLCFSLVSGLLCSCVGPASSSPVPLEQRSDHLSGPADTVEVVYFHRARRCVACVYVEERVGYIVNTFFQDELNSGKLTFQIYDLGDEKNAAIANKYGAVGSQLFINAIKGGVDHVRHIQEIWFWDCLDNEDVFDETVKNIIKKGLYGVG